MNPTQLLPLLRRSFVAAVFAAVVAFAGAQTASGQTPPLEPAQAAPQRGVPPFAPAASERLAAAPARDYIFLEPAGAAGDGKMTDGHETDGSETANDGSRQNIKMHGHWVIDVKNPDGTTTEHRDFDNSITANGAAYLIGLMAGYGVPSDYGIFLAANSSDSGTPPCVTPNGGQPGCFIVRSLTANPGSTTCQVTYCAVSLTYTYNESLSTTSGNSMVLAGSFTAGQAGTIGYVGTEVGSCPVNITQSSSLTTTSPSACTAQTGNFGINTLSAASISSVAVASGQIVQVTVTISFS